MCLHACSVSSYTLKYTYPRYNRVMETIVSSIIVAIETVLAIALLALIAGFSPTLYLAQVGRSSRSARTRHDAQLLITGVAGALVFMLILFQFLHLDALLHLLGSTVSALAVNTLTNLTVGSLCIYGGVRYLNKPRDPSILPSVGSSSTLIGFAFIRTMFSMSGITATFVGANLIAETSPGIAIRIVLTGIFLVVAIAPFIGIMLMIGRQPTTLRHIHDALRRIGDKLRYRTVVGGITIAVGVVVIALQVIRLLFIR